MLWQGRSVINHYTVNTTNMNSSNEKGCVASFDARPNKRACLTWPTVVKQEENVKSEPTVESQGSGDSDPTFAVAIPRVSNYCTRMSELLAELAASDSSEEENDGSGEVGGTHADGSDSERSGIHVGGGEQRVSERSGIHVDGDEQRVSERSGIHVGGDEQRSGLHAGDSERSGLHADDSERSGLLAGDSEHSYSTLHHDDAGASQGRALMDPQHVGSMSPVKQEQERGDSVFGCHALSGGGGASR